MSEFLIITGVSGAGRSQAADTFEDLGWFVIDNLPPALIAKVAELVQAPGATTERVALVVGTGHYLDELTPALDAAAGHARPGCGSCSSKPATRSSSAATRTPAAATPWPSPTGSRDGIERERALLDPVKSQADVVVDTSDLNVHQLRDRLLELFGNDVRGPDADQRRVVRLQARPPARRRPRLRLPLPAQPPLGRGACGPSPASTSRCSDYVAQPARDRREFLAKLDDLLGLLLPAYVKEGKSYLSIAVGCTGGTHRSVFIAEELAKLLEQRGFRPMVSHRDLGK